MKTFKLICVGVLIAYLHFSCSKGKDGTQGAPGTANVVYCPSFLSGTGWDATSAPTYSPYALFDKATQEISQLIIDSGVVLAHEEVLQADKC